MTVYPNFSSDHSQRFRDLLNLGGVLRLKGNTLEVTLKTIQQCRCQETAQEFVRKIERLSAITFGASLIRFDLPSATGQFIEPTAMMRSL